MQTVIELTFAEANFERLGRSCIGALCGKLQGASILKELLLF
jgi:hypothetical protein